MILARLAEYERRQDTSPVLYTERPVRYVIDLDREGRPHGSPVDLADPSDSRGRRGQRRFLPTMQRSYAIKPILFADKGDYTLGPPPEADARQRKRAEEAHAAYRQLVARAARETGLSEVEAVRKFLESSPRAQLSLPEDFDEGATITFRVDGHWVVELPEVQQFWAEEAQSDDAPTMQCLVCGRLRPALDRLQLKVKGVPGGQPAGTSIISANAPAFESYGLEASQIAPTCAECGEAFTKGLNRLLSDPRTHIRFPGVAYGFWTREEAPGFDVATFLTRPEPDDVRALLESARRGRERAAVDANAFYALSVSGSGGRTVVRSWIESTVPEVQESLSLWFQKLRVVGFRGREPRALGLWALAGATVRELNDASPWVFDALLRSALLGVAPPEALLFAGVRRNLAEQSVTEPRAALIKLVLASVYGWKEDEMVDLDPSTPSVAYQCGRLLAVVERAQAQALGIRAVTERFYGSASTAPASVFGNLIRGAMHHLAKLERDKPGAYYGIQRDLEEVTSLIPEFPRTLTLRDQGMFALGYYHQRAVRRRGTGAEENKGGKQEGGNEQ